MREFNASLREFYASFKQDSVIDMRTNKGIMWNALMAQNETTVQQNTPCIPNGRDGKFGNWDPMIVSPVLCHWVNWPSSAPPWHSWTNYKNLKSMQSLFRNRAPFYDYCIQDIVIKWWTIWNFNKSSKYLLTLRKCISILKTDIDIIKCL